MQLAHLTLLKMPCWSRSYQLPCHPLLAPLLEHIVYADNSIQSLLQGHAASAPDTGGDAMLVSQLSASMSSTASTFVPADITPAIERMLQVGCMESFFHNVC